MARRCFSERPGHLIELAAQAAREGASLVIAVGGDGTLNETVNGVMRAGAPPSWRRSPLGTGMDFGRTYGIPSRFDDAVRTRHGHDAARSTSGRVSYRT